MYLPFHHISFLSSCYSASYMPGCSLLPEHSSIFISACNTRCLQHSRQDGGRYTYMCGLAARNFELPVPLLGR